MNLGSKIIYLLLGVVLGGLFFGVVLDEADLDGGVQTRRKILIEFYI